MNRMFSLRLSLAGLLIFSLQVQANAEPTCTEALKTLIAAQKATNNFASHFKNVEAPGNVMGFAQVHTQDLKAEHIASLMNLSKKMKLPPEQLRIKLDSILTASPNPPIYRAIRLLEVAELTRTPYPELRKSLDSLEKVFVSSQKKLGFNDSEIPEHFNPDQIIRLYLANVSMKNVDVPKVYIEFFRTFENTRAEPFLTFIQILNTHGLEANAAIEHLKAFKVLKTQPGKSMGFSSIVSSQEKVMNPSLEECLSLLELQKAMNIPHEEFTRLVDELAQGASSGDWRGVIENLVQALPKKED